MRLKQKTNFSLQTFVVDQNVVQAYRWCSCTESHEMSLPKSWLSVFVYKSMDDKNRMFRKPCYLLCLGLLVWYRCTIHSFIYIFIFIYSMYVFFSDLYWSHSILGLHYYKGELSVFPLCWCMSKSPPGPGPRFEPKT
jgi:hypothetical protein